MLVDSLQVDFSADPQLEAGLRLSDGVSFQVDARVQVLPASGDEPLYSRDLSDQVPVAWLPRGLYTLRCELRDLSLEPGDYRCRLVVLSEVAGQRQQRAEATVDVRLDRALKPAGLRDPAWSLAAWTGTPPVEDLAWRRGHRDWFFRHFDHAALVVTDYLLCRHPALRGRILDVGCGDGIIDLGIFLRMQPKELVGIDPFRGFERLPGILAANLLPADLLDDPRLHFEAADANAIPFPDDHFDVVVSWGSLEHIAGGYGQALDEIQRVLKRDGLLFAHPGLYFGALGNHLGEFFDDPWIHLKRSPEELREAVLNTEPRRMDRAGHVATSAEYWQWYTELNRITVADFERELRERGFEPWRVAVRSSDIIEYTPELRDRPILDLATAEIYLSARNRK